MPETIFFVISKGRHANVPAMRALFPNKRLHWVVPSAEETLYTTAGAEVTIACEGLSNSRNRAISYAAEKGCWCFQLDDDIKSSKRLGVDGKGKDISVEAAADIMVQRAGTLEHEADRFFGVAPTPNPFYGSLKVKRNVFVVASFSLYKPGRCRYDTSIPLKEDYDFTCQVFASGEGVVRFDDLLLSIQHYTNAGGAVADRNPEKEQHSIAILKRKWPGYFRDNPKRPNEVLMKLPKPKFSIV